MREDASDGTRALVRACAFIVIIAVTLVGVALIVGELTVSRHSRLGATQSSSDFVAGTQPQNRPAKDQEL